MFQNQSQNNLTKEKERLKSTDFTHFSVQMCSCKTILFWWQIIIFARLPSTSTKNAWKNIEICLPYFHIFLSENQLFPPLKDSSCPPLPPLLTFFILIIPLKSPKSKAYKEKEPEKRTKNTWWLCKYTTVAPPKKLSSSSSFNYLSLHFYSYEVPESSIL